MLFAVCSPAFSAVIPPQWIEFCPPRFLNAKYKSDNFFNRFQYPNTMYWYKRRIEFENEISNCDKTSESYAQIRNIENNKTNVFYSQKNIDQHSRNANHNGMSIISPNGAGGYSGLNF